MICSAAHIFASSSFLNIYLTGWVSVAAHRILSCGMPTPSCGMWDLVPWPRIKPGHWEPGVLATGPPGSPIFRLFTDTMDCSPPGSYIHEIFQEGILDWAAISSSRGSSWLRDWTIGRQILHHRATWKSQGYSTTVQKEFPRLGKIARFLRHHLSFYHTFHTYYIAEPGLGAEATELRSTFLASGYWLVSGKHTITTC